MLKTGQDAPEFTLPDQDGKKHSLSDYRGRWVVLYFYPKDDTPGCTKEACGFRDVFSEFEKGSIVILGISKDSVKKHRKFADKYGLPFNLLSDENGTVCEDYGVWQEKSMYGKNYMGIIRSTYLIGPEGKVEKVYQKIKVDSHATEVLDDIQKPA